MSRGDVEHALIRNDPEELRTVSLSVAMHPAEAEWAESVCLTLVTHPDSNVRGNADLALGHLARVHGRLGREAIAVVESGLRDPDSYVRGQANAAADDLEHFLGWQRAQ